ncbi:MAG: branched-chain amino acid ABC transporter ATP-binding protein/permease [Candidatus Dormibacteraeota bacterium]|uniref:Branched-chain amino acid ABC transporter ATP-binding protein/permease n=1 Tax=Candidatus Aeolococcus gillhamiae TaxID=3127015 RepID=A0A934N4W9_9BACT|nr:branched-chain amino acid ABC transporter ATP-binding protein/permease [Candidatus Dormibacteraeota bacterium]
MPGAARVGWRAVVLDWALPIALCVVFIAAISQVDDRYLARVIALVVVWALIGMSWNLIGGYAGQPSLGQAAFVGLGAYTAILLMIRVGLTPWLGLVAAAGVAIVAALVIGIPTLRLKGVYFALASLVYPLILLLVFTYLGYQEVLVPAHNDNPDLYMSWSDTWHYAALAALFLLLAWLFTTALERSRWRVVLQSIREDEDAARSTGINTALVKLVVFSTSAVFASLAGVVYAMLILVVTPEAVFGLSVSVQALVVSLVGGMARRLGPILGACILIPITNFLDANLGATSGASLLAYGLVLITVVLVVPRGLLNAGTRPLEVVNRVLPQSLRLPVNRRRSLPSRPPSGSRPLVPTHPGDEAVLIAADARKVYGGIVAIDRLSLEVRSGEFLGIVGPNGAGKSTFFDLLTGYQRSTAGRITLLGRVVTHWPAYRIARLGVRRSFQIARPFGQLTVFDNVFLGSLQNADGGQRTADTWAALEAVGLEVHADVGARSLVPAQLRLLEVARALAGRPAILLLDEPLAGLTRSEARDLMQLLRTQQHAGLTIVLVDHDIGTVAAWADRLYVIDYGRNIADGAPKEVMRDDRVVTAYLGSRWRAARA